MAAQHQGARRSRQIGPHKLPSLTVLATGIADADDGAAIAEDTYPVAEPPRRLGLAGAFGDDVSRAVVAYHQQVLGVHPRDRCHARGELRPLAAKVASVSIHYAERCEETLREVPPHKGDATAVRTPDRSHIILVAGHKPRELTGIPVP